MKLFIYRFTRRLKAVEYRVVAWLALTLLAGLKLLPADSAMAFCDRWARRLGPFFGRHKVALDNLRHAYPEKSDAEREAIASDMWGNMARLMAEYVFLDQIIDYDPQNPNTGRIEVEGSQRFVDLVENQERPAIFFTAHMGNFELLPVAAEAYDLQVTALFRAPNNPYLAEKLLSARRTTMGHMLPSRAGAALELARVLERGGNVGMLVDQKFTRGIKTKFFGRDCLTSPLLGKLARNFPCDIYPACSVRLPNGRFKLTLFEPIEQPLDEKGRLDVNALTQAVTSIVEEWVREDPGQWQWFHKRWQMGKAKQ